MSYLLFYISSYFFYQVNRSNRGFSVLQDHPFAMHTDPKGQGYIAVLFLVFSKKVETNIDFSFIFKLLYCSYLYIRLDRQL